MGDSFVEASQVPAPESFCALLEQQTVGIEVRNFGVSSYSPVLYWLQWLRDVKSYRPDHVFLLLYDNDVSGDEMYARSAVYRDQEIVAVPGAGGGRLGELLRKSYVVRLVRKVQLKIVWMLKHSGSDDSAGPRRAFAEERLPISELTEKYLLLLARDMEAAGTALTILAVPSRNDLSGRSSGGTPSFAANVRKWAAAHGLDYFDLTPAFEQAAEPYFFSRDIHFNQAGHRAVAESLRHARLSGEWMKK